MTPLGGIFVYMVLQFGIGVWVSRRIRTEADYILAGRNLGYALATFSIFATWFGAETVVGSAGRVYREGVSFGSAEPFGYGLCIVLMGLVFAVPLWRRKLTTLADLYRQRFSPGTERLAAVLLVPGSVLWAAAQMRAFGHVLSISSDALDTGVALIVAAGFTILYTTFGGMLADAFTDLIQGTLLVVALVILGVVAVQHAGGTDALGRVLADPARVYAFPRGESTLALLERWAIPVAGSVLATELVGRVLAARSPQVAQRSALGAATLYISIGLIPVTIGLLGPTLAPTMADAEALLPHLAREILPGVLYVLFAGALVSAILSTVDSTLLMSSAVFSHNLVVPALRIGEERHKVAIARAGVVFFGIIAYVLARSAEGVFALVEQASALTAGTLVTVAFGLFTNWGGPRTAIVSLATGILTYIAASIAAVEAPFLLSLGASFASYVVGATLESRSALAAR